MAVRHRVYVVERAHRPSRGRVAEQINFRVHGLALRWDPVSERDQAGSARSRPAGSAYLRARGSLHADVGVYGQRIS